MHAHEKKEGVISSMSSLNYIQYFIHCLHMLPGKTYKPSTCVHCYSCIIPNTQIVHNMSWRIQVHFTQPGFALAEISREIAANGEWRRHWPLRGPGGRDSRRGDQCRTNLTKRLISAWQDRRVVFSDTWNSRVRYLQYLDQRYLVGKGRGKVFRAFWIIDHKQIF